MEPNEASSSDAGHVSLMGKISTVFTLLMFTVPIASLLTGAAALRATLGKRSRWKAAAIIGMVLALVMHGLMAKELLEVSQRLKSQPVFSGPVPKQFEQANNSIMTLKGGDAAHGSSQTAKELAGDFSRRMEEMQKVTFTGGDKNRVLSLTHDKFLTYCHLTPDSAVFLVHVPQFKNYKQETRDVLTQLAWSVAEQVLKDAQRTEVQKVAIGLRGALAYGALAIGERGKEPQTENAFTVPQERLYGFFGN